MTKPNTLRVVALVADDNFITLYLDNGQERVLKNGEYHTKDIVAKVTPALSKNQKPTIEIEAYRIHEKIEEATNGFVRFVRVAKKIFKPSGWFQTPTEYRESEQNNVVHEPIPDVKAIDAVASKDIPEKLDDEDTVVGIVGDKVIPGMDQIQNQMKYASTTNAVGLQAFMERISKVINNRGHSVEDLLKFLKKADLPITDDGSIIAYKALQQPNMDEELFVDCHTGKVTQQIGSFVFMSPKLVDPSRGQDCSNGLHIARRSYLGSFSGNVIVICVIAPEDVIAVPHYSPNKVRVSGYHIVAKVDKDAYNHLKRNQPMTTDNPEMAKLLNSIIATNYPAPIESVEIGGHKGSKISITKLEKPKDDKNFILTSENASILSSGSEPLSEEKVKPSDINAVVEKAKAEPVEELFDVYVTNNHKKKINHIKLYRAINDAGLKLAKEAVEADAPIKTGLTRKDADKLFGDIIKTYGFSASSVPTGSEKPFINHEWKVEPKDVPEKAPVADSNTMTTNDQARSIYTSWVRFGLESDLDKLLAFKKSKKKSFSKLGFSAVEEGYIKARKLPAKKDPKPKAEPKPTASKEPTEKLTIKEQASKMFLAGQYKELPPFAKSKKKSLKSLGFNDSQIAIIKANS